MVSINTNRSFLILSIISGIIFTLSWPARGFPFLIFFAFIPLFIIEEKLLQNKKNNSSFHLLLYAWFAFVIWNGLTTYWIVFSTVTGAFLAIFINSFFMAVPLYLSHLIRRKLPGQNSLISFIFLWISFEYIHMNWELSWSWLNLGNAFSKYPHWVQWYDTTGVLGGSAWILLLNTLFYSIYKIFFHEHELTLRLKRFLLIATIGFFIFPSIISFVKYYSYEEKYSPVEIVIVQPNFDPYNRQTTPEGIIKDVDLMLNLADKHITSETRFVLFPEGAIRGSVNVESPENSASISRINSFLNEHDSLSIITGLMAFELYENQKEASPTARPYRGNFGYYYDIYNAALMLDQRKEYIFYSKSKLVPGVERMPLYWLFRPLDDLIVRLGGIPGSMASWENQKPYHAIDSTKVYIPICYESIYGEHVGKYILQNAELILIITNDGWWRDTPGYRQHNQYARLRAIETRRSIARAASTGISSFIDQRGNIIENTEWNEQTVIRNSINKNDKLTLYTIYGDYLGRFASFVSLLIIIYFVVQLFLIKKKK